MDMNGKSEQNTVDELVFAKESESAAEGSESVEPWTILIADDDIMVHKITKMVLEDYAFDKRQVRFLDSYSGKETREVIRHHPETAVVLLDVVMEEDDAGLGVVKFIRNELKNGFVRIILRTGQPGKAPENKIIYEYDINDYKEKTELTAQKLFTTVTSALRTYRDLRIIEKSRKGLEQIIDSSAFLFDTQSLKKFAEGLLTQLISILNLDESSIYVQLSGFAASSENGKMIILAATGKFQNTVNKTIESVIPQDLRPYLEKAIQAKRSVFIDDVFVGYFATRGGVQNVLFVNGTRNLTELDRNLIQIFSTNVAIAFENIYLNREIIDTQKEVIIKLGEVVETRCKETANHVQRVAEFSYHLALMMGIDEAEAELLRQASPMHDVGKVGVPDAILLKPGKLTTEEFEQIKSHTTIGHRLLKNSNREIIRSAAIVAFEHHERWDGQGYPQGLSGTNIHIFGRITGIVDVFDALLHKREYKEAWDIDRVVEFIRSERDKHFDPKIVDVFLSHVNDFLKLNDLYPEE
ncbi:MAG: DUF3369 domain-containing protein [Chitinivibrionales bacterium]|nr:DUF3369 domain-containing protein [Chitinivibrionales bacterium]